MGDPLDIQNENSGNQKAKRKSKHLCSSLEINICWLLYYLGAVSFSPPPALFMLVRDGDL